MVSKSCCIIKLWLIPIYLILTPKLENLPTNELEVVNNVIEEIRKKSSERHIKSFALPVCDLEDSKVEEVEECTEKKISKYEVS
jgi:rRNA maturation endonuclease Nob1